MLTLNDRNILALGMPIDGREFTRYFSGFPITSLDQQVICYHKKSFHLKNRKDIGSGMEVFLGRATMTKEALPAGFLESCATYGQLMVRDEAIYGLQVHIPLTAERMGKEQDYMDMVKQLWDRSYVVVQSLIQTKEFPLLQRSVTDPTLLELIAAELKQIENQPGSDIVHSIASVERRNNLVTELTNRCEESGYKTDMLDEYDIMSLRCDS